MTLNPRSADHMRPQTTFSAYMYPVGSITFTDATRTLGATPMTPLPFLAAAMIPATDVPWPAAGA